MSKPFNREDTIAALATPHGTGALAIIRISGKDCFKLFSKIFYGKNGKKKDVSKYNSHTVHLGNICEGKDVIDEVLVTVFKSPSSYSGEDCAEISCHGSSYIQQRILDLLVKSGARLATAGEFTFRAFMNGRFDLSQAEAVADLIASTSQASHDIAMKQMRGGFSDKIKILRDNLINFASLVELELDFSEEDVEFADRKDLKKLVITMMSFIKRLIDSFEVGNVIKEGIPVAIVGKPNAGKSTLLNALLDEERAIVSDIPGTTRDTIEDVFNIEGVQFRFIDTAGIRNASDEIEKIGVQRTLEKMRQASIVLYLFDVHEMTVSELTPIIADLRKQINGAELFVIGNKIDKEDEGYTKKEFSSLPEIFFISAKEKRGIEALKVRLISIFDTQTLGMPETIVTNARHAEALRHAHQALEKVYDGLNRNLSGELLASDIRSALHHLGIITGEVTTEDLLQNIFSRFCIGK